ncbi:MAG: LAGLIDADG family homing endonuclease, partial [Microgenomates group bacterium]
IEILAMTDDYKIKPAKLIKAFKTGVKITYLLKTQSGREIKATANHKFYCLDGWRRLDQLKTGDLIAVPRLVEFSGLKNITDQELIFFAHMLGDGCYVKNQPLHYTSASLKNIQIVKKTAKELFKINGRLVKQKNWYHLYLPSPFHLTHHRHHPFVEWLKSKNLNLAHSYEKELPLDFMALEKEKIKLFLHHLWATDGNLSWKKIKGRKLSASIYYSSTSKQLIDQLQYLLLRLGILSTIRVLKKKNYRPNYQVHIQGKENQLKFLKSVGVFGKDDLVKKLIKAIEKIKSNTNLDIIPKQVWQLFVKKEKERQDISWRQLANLCGTSYSGSSLFKNNVGRERLERIAQVLKSEVLKNLANSDIYWDKVVAIEKLGNEEVFDATVDGVHNFVANKIIVHNSIEQDSDVVMFLYQEEETEDLLDQNKRLVKLFIAKHRNGPIGEIDLMFRGDRVKFYGVEK